MNDLERCDIINVLILISTQRKGIQSERYVFPNKKQSRNETYRIKSKVSSFHKRFYEKRRHCETASCSHLQKINACVRKIPLLLKKWYEKEEG
jgi:hypothetical protein